MSVSGSQGWVEVEMALQQVNQKHKLGVFVSFHPRCGLCVSKHQLCSTCFDLCGLKCTSFPSDLIQHRSKGWSHTSLGFMGVFVVHCLEYIFISLRNLYPYRSRNNHSDCSSLWGVCLCKLLPGPVGLLVTQNISLHRSLETLYQRNFSWAYKTMRNVSWGVIVAYILHSIMLNGSTSGFWGHSYSLFLVYWFSIDQYTCSCFAHHV